MSSVSGDVHTAGGDVHTAGGDAHTAGGLHKGEMNNFPSQKVYLPKALKLGLEWGGAG